jgi:hypothetical protein
MIEGKEFAQLIGEHPRQLLGLPTRRKGVADAKHGFVALRFTRDKHVSAHTFTKKPEPDCSAIFYLTI